MRALVLLLAALLAACGYRVGGRGDLIPKNIKTIAVPAFANQTVRYRLSQRMPEAISREFLTRTRYQVVSDENAADAVLSGSVLRYAAYPNVFSPTTGRAQSVEVHVYVAVTLRDRRTGQVILSRPNMDIKERYEISVDPAAYFEESDAALDRMSRDVARSVVSAVLEAF